MSILVVAVADCKVSRAADVKLVTYALGSCVAVSAYDPYSRAAGLLHVMLPFREASSRGHINRYISADTAVPGLIKAISEIGGERTRLIVCVAGGAQMMAANREFHIGRRNYRGVRDALEAAGLRIQAEAVGGGVARNVELDVNTGLFNIQEEGGTPWTLHRPQPMARAALKFDF